VKAWLEHFQEEGGEDFKIDRVACLGKRFAARTKADLKEFADGLVGIDIFNAKEALLTKQSAPSHEGQHGKRKAVDSPKVYPEDDPSASEQTEIIQANIKEFIGQEPKLFQEFFDEELDDQTKKSMLDTPEEHCGECDAMVVMKMLTGLGVQGGDQLIANILWVRAETRAIHRNAMLQAKYYHSRKGKTNPLEKLPESKSFVPVKKINGVVQHVLITGNPGTGKQ